VELMETFCSWFSNQLAVFWIASIIGSGINGNSLSLYSSKSSGRLSSLLLLEVELMETTIIQFPFQPAGDFLGIASIIGSGINGNRRGIDPLVSVCDIASIIGSGINGNGFTLSLNWTPKLKNRFYYWKWN